MAKGSNCVKLTEISAPGEMIRGLHKIVQLLTLLPSSHYTNYTQS